MLESTHPQVILMCVDSYVLLILPKLSYTSDAVTNIDFSDHFLSQRSVEIGLISHEDSRKFGTYINTYAYTRMIVSG